MVGAASEDMLRILSKRKYFCEQYFSNLKIAINLKLPVKDFNFKFGVYDIRNNSEDVYTAFICVSIALSAAKTEDIKISEYFTEPIAKELAGEPNLEEAFLRGIKEKSMKCIISLKLTLKLTLLFDVKVWLDGIVRLVVY